MTLNGYTRHIKSLIKTNKHTLTFEFQGGRLQNSKFRTKTNTAVNTTNTKIWLITRFPNQTKHFLIKTKTFSNQRPNNKPENQSKLTPTFYHAHHIRIRDRLPTISQSDKNLNVECGMSLRGDVVDNKICLKIISQGLLSKRMPRSFYGMTWHVVG